MVYNSKRGAQCAKWCKNTTFSSGHLEDPKKLKSPCAPWCIIPKLVHNAPNGAQQRQIPVKW